MYKATRLLIDERVRHSKYNLQQVSVKSVPIGIANKCHHNTFEFQKKDVLKTGCTGSVPGSGWLVCKYNKIKNETEIIQHWWNIDSITKQHFDTTPITDGTSHSEYEYVTDFEVSIWGNENYEEIDSNVCNSICLRNGKWYLVKEGSNGKLIYKLTDTLTVQNLFAELSD